MGEELDTQLLNAVMDVADGLELASTLRRIVEAATQLVDARYGALGVLDEDGRLIDFIHVGMEAEQVSKIGTLPEGRGVLGLLGSDREPLRITDLMQHVAAVGFPEGHPHMHSFLGVPIEVREELFGNLYLTEKRDRQAFTAEDERTVVALAAAAGVAIENARLYERARQREKWQRALTTIATAVMEGTDPSEILRMVARMAREVTGADAALIALPRDDSPLVVTVVESPEEQPGWLGRDVPDGSIAHTAFSLATSVTQPECTLWAGNDELCSAVALPLNTPERVLGVLVLMWPLYGWSGARNLVDLAESFATQAAVSLIQAAARHESQRLALLEDRDRIARDLHDLVIQRLFATGMMLQGVHKLKEVPEDALTRVDRAVDNLDETIKEIRQTIFALHEPLDGPSASTRGRVMQEIAQSAALLGFEPSVRFLGPVDTAITPAMSEQLIGALREALTNSAKHAKSTRVDALVAVEGDDALLIVSDDGVGMPADGNVHRSGVANLMARALELGGTCTVERISDAGGTRVTWHVPLDIGVPN